jgi:general stress protein 26
MNKVEGLEEGFQEARAVYFTTFKDGEERNRLMTNLNKDPYSMMWFPTNRDTRKVEDIKNNPKVLITFPSLTEGKYFEIEGKAELENADVTAEKWRWWYLYWHPSQRRRFWFPGTRKDPNRVIINVYPQSARLVKK